MVYDFFTELGLTAAYADLAGKAVLVTGVLLLSIIVNFLTKRIGLKIITKLTAKTATRWDDIMVEKGMLTRLAHITPLLVLYFTLPGIFKEYSGAGPFIERVLLSALIIIMLTVANAFISSVNEIYSGYKISKNRPIKGYLQIVRVFVSILCLVLVIATLLNRSALGLLSGIGALSAVLMLVFKDSILGLVAAIQLSGNDMVRIGDWISLPDHGADGDVIDIKLQTVTVQNFDKTIVSVPIYSLISSSFRNWRGMSESGGRRIKRHISIDMNSVKFCSEELLNRLKGVKILCDYLVTRQKEIDEHNQSANIGVDSPVNGRRMTNLGVFRAYISAYLKNHAKIDESMTFLVRQLQPTDKGIPLEIYVFCRDQVWADYESIQADIFDHILASISFFDLAVYQAPSSLDFKLSFTPGTSR